MSRMVMVVDNSLTEANPWQTGIALTTIGIVETIGNSLLSAIMYYEKYGMDSMKRTVANQLWYFLILSLILNNVFGLPFLAYRVVSGPIGMYYLKWALTI